MRSGRIVEAPLRATLDDLARPSMRHRAAIAARLPGRTGPLGGARCLRRRGHRRVSSARRSPTDGSAPEADRGPDRDVLALLEAQRWRLAMFASCGWYWDVPARPETQGVIRAAVHAARLIDGLSDTTFEQDLESARPPASARRVASVGPRIARPQHLPGASHRPDAHRVGCNAGRTQPLAFRHPGRRASASAERRLGDRLATSGRRSRHDLAPRVPTDRLDVGTAWQERGRSPGTSAVGRPARAWSGRGRHMTILGLESVSPRPARHGLTREAGVEGDARWVVTRCGGYWIETGYEIGGDPRTRRGCRRPSTWRRCREGPARRSRPGG